jgi:ring-1,2-phenylacetyl-CoA epoxidase subunit PaaD
MADVAAADVAAADVAVADVAVTMVAKAEASVAGVPDPELPWLTIAELGILRGVEIEDDHVVVSITPTYSGCPALREIQHDIRRRLANIGCPDAEVRTVLSPAWTSDWITAAGRTKLAAAGIAPPNPAGRPATGVRTALTLSGVRHRIPCPRCGSEDTAELSRFAATACQALYRCRSCAEPFNYVKEI